MTPMSMPRAPWTLLLTVVALLGTVQAAHAQSAQKYSLQLSGLSTAFTVDTASGGVRGFGFEPQLRFNRVWQSEGAGTVSLGIGGQWSRHTYSVGDEVAGVDLKYSITGVFIEPRWVRSSAIGGFYPYVSGRVALLHQSSVTEPWGDIEAFPSSSSWGKAVGLGAGVAYPLTKRINFDAGVAVLYQQFGDYIHWDGSEDLTLSFPASTSYAAKVGLSIGLSR